MFTLIMSLTSGSRRRRTPDRCRTPVVHRSVMDDWTPDMNRAVVMMVVVGSVVVVVVVVRTVVVVVVVGAVMMMTVPPALAATFARRVTMPEVTLSSSLTRPHLGLMLSVPVLVAMLPVDVLVTALHDLGISLVLSTSLCLEIVLVLVMALPPFVLTLSLAVVFSSVLGSVLVLDGSLGSLSIAFHVQV